MKTKIIENGKEVVAKPIKKTGVLHNIFIMDASGSMNQASYVDGVRISKYDVAMKGINDEINALKKKDEGDVNISVFEFDSMKHGQERITEHYFNTKLAKVDDIKFKGAEGNTPLYQTIAYVINKMLVTATNDDTVLIKIFTDGAHNCSWGITEAECRDLIKSVEDKREFVITFIGTQQDTRHMINNLGLNTGNTISYDGTSMGFAGASVTAYAATSSMLSGRRGGMSLKSKSKNFFSSVTKDELEELTKELEKSKEEKKNA